MKIRTGIKFKAVILSCKIRRLFGLKPRSKHAFKFLTRELVGVMEIKSKQAYRDNNRRIRDAIKSFNPIYFANMTYVERKNAILPLING